MGFAVVFHAFKTLEGKRDAKRRQIVQKDKLRVWKTTADGRRALYAARSRSGSGGGLHTSENAGMSSENYVRIIMAERLRI